MFYRLLLAVSIALSAFLGGCAAPTKMAFADGTESTITPERAIYLMTATVKNSYRLSHQPKVLNTILVKNPDDAKPEAVVFGMDIKSKIETDTSAGSTYLLRMELVNGSYVVRGFNSMSSSFPIHGFFFTPVHAKFEAERPGVFYLGHIEANVRERQGDEFKAGPSIPLIDQAVAGASTGTFDIEITDRWASDEALFVDKFPVLKTAKVEKKVLAPFDRAKAQKWWQDN
jgi:hypothetical protein